MCSAAATTIELGQVNVSLAQIDGRLRSIARSAFAGDRRGSLRHCSPPAHPRRSSTGSTPWSSCPGVTATCWTWPRRPETRRRHSARPPTRLSHRARLWWPTSRHVPVSSRARSRLTGISTLRGSPGKRPTPSWAIPVSGGPLVRTLRLARVRHRPRRTCKTTRRHWCR